MRISISALSKNSSWDWFPCIFYKSWKSVPLLVNSWTKKQFVPCCWTLRKHGGGGWGWVIQIFYHLFWRFPFTLKGQSHEIFASCLFHELSSPKPQKITIGSFHFFWKFAENFANQGAPPASMTPASNFTIGTAGVVNTGSKFATSIIPTVNLPKVSLGTISDCLHFKVNLKLKFICMLTLLTKGVQRNN